tara:strand:+ start:177 stop:620 length:444 start_codon:yes stop_codon:yes gene_type:complete
MGKCFNRLTRVDSIRLIKLLEIIYYALISFLLTLIITNILENDKLISTVFKKYDYSKVSFQELLKDVIIDISILAVYLYYLKKLLSCIPSLLVHLDKDYVSNKKNEVTIGISLGTGIIIYTSLPTVKDKLKELDIKMKKYINQVFIE